MENKETRYIKNNWFGVFPLGQETPGEYNWIDSQESKLGGNKFDVTYFINEWRYRGFIKPGPNVPASFGCSHAFGYGVNVPYAKIIGFANCAVNGISNDAIVRMAYTYCEQFKPNKICILWTMPNRREYVEEDGTIQKFKAEENHQLLALQNSNWDQYNLEKNKIFISSYCKANNIKLLEYDFMNNDKGARDGLHPGPDWHVNMAATILEDLNV